MLPELRRAESLIIDLRNNGGGNSSTGARILEYLTPRDTIEMSRSRTRQNVAAYKAWGAFLSPQDTIGSPWSTRNYLAAHDRLYLDFGTTKRAVEVPLGERIIVPTVVLMGNFTASAAEDFLIMVDGQENVTTIGHRSFGSTGQPLYVNLVGGIGARICTKDDTYPDGRAFVGVGVVPDIEVPQPSLADLKSGRDPDLEKALDYLDIKQ
jgi:C-terminal processing protease CtpA/Prc